MTPPVSNKGHYDQTLSAQRLFLEFHSFLSLNFHSWASPTLLAGWGSWSWCLHPSSRNTAPSVQKWVRAGELNNSVSETAVQVQQGEVTQGLLLQHPWSSAAASPWVFLSLFPPCVGLSDFVANIIWLKWNRDISKQKQEPVLGAAEVHCRTGFHFSLVHCSSPLRWENGISCDPVSRNWWESNAGGAREVGRWQLLCKSCLVLVLLGHTLARNKEIELIWTLVNVRDRKSVV